MAARLTKEKIAGIFASPFLRCIQTAHWIAKELELEIRVEPALSEWLNPEWFPSSLHLLSAIELQRFSDRIDLSYRPRGAPSRGESGIEALRRSGDVVQQLAEDYGGNLFAVGHGASVLGGASGLLSIAPESAAQAPPVPDLPQGALVVLVARDDTWELGSIATVDDT